ncbi:hypothetical protein DMUE_5391 [Dictyocoela muelleri]|nr:hypothetical protein DMUE_5391 [Dictyocoela muelleri]
MDLLMREIEKTDFLSLILEESRDCKLKCQVSDVLRYVFNGEIKERFIKFIDVTQDMTFSGLFEIVKSLEETFSFKKKLVAQTYDGAPVMSSSINGLQKRLLKDTLNHYFSNVQHII